jgi:CBS domain-containing protein
MSASTCAKDIMTKKVFILKDEERLRSAWSLFKTHNISGAPVVNAQGDLVGVLSQHDVLCAVTALPNSVAESQSFYFAPSTFGAGIIAEGDGLSPKFDELVGQCMNPDVITVQESTPVADVASLMCRNHIHRVIVANGKKVQGLISVFDLLKLVG